MFKIGEKAVYIGGNIQDHFNRPQQNEIVTIDEIDSDGDYGCVGYKETKRNTLQFFTERELRKLDHSFAEDVLSRIKEKVKEESLASL